MEFFDVIHARHSIRAFQPKEVEEDKLRQILETANAAPSAGDLQAYEIYLVRKPEQKRALARAALQQDFIAAAPVVLVFCTNPSRNQGRYRERGIRLYSVQDASVACTFAMLAVTALGLATVWVGAFSDEEVARIIGTPKGVTPVAMLPIGYAGETPETTPRRSLRDLVHEVK